MSIDQLTTCLPSEAIGLERTNFFPFQRVGPDDLTQDQIYFREKHRRHNRLLHGWGVVCGVRLRAGEQPCQVIVEPGYVLGPYGDEIVIDRPVPVDLCREGLDGNAVSPCGEGLDPWCSDIRVDRRADQVLYIAVRYAECRTRPVQSAAGGCGCDLSECEYSRIRDSYAIKVLTRLPSTYSDPMPEPDSDGLVACVGNQARACPDCPTEPWVILGSARLTVDGQISSIDCFSYRRYIVSFADYYFLCRSDRDRGSLDDIRIRAREIARRLRRPILVDLLAPADATPALSVAVRSHDDSWVTLPIHFSVNPGETYATLLAREGDRQYYDLATDDTYTLREMFAFAEVDPTDPVRNVTQAVAPLEGTRLRISDLRVLRTGVETLLDSSGTNRWTSDFAGRIDAVSELPTTTLKGVDRSSVLGQRLAGSTISDVADRDEQEFLDQVLHGIDADERDRVARQARDVWESARRVAALQLHWTNRP